MLRSMLKCNSTLNIMFFENHNLELSFKSSVWGFGEKLLWCCPLEGDACKFRRFANLYSTILCAAKNLHALIYLRQVFLFVIIRLFYKILQEVSIKNSTKFRKNCTTIKSPFFLKKVRKKLLIIKNIFLQAIFLIYTQVK